MKPESVSFEEGVFAGALALPPAERSAFVRRACGNDAACGARIEALLQAHEAENGVLDDMPVAERLGIARLLQAQAPTVVDEPGWIGRYRLQRKIGEGGFGVVWLAEQVEPVQRVVALKVIRLGLDSAEVTARFEVERQALALMDHPNIARVYDGGTTAGGRPYLVMEFVPGIPITQYCDEHRLPTAVRLQLFLQVCRAVQHAHHKGVLHRDLKPSNILVAEQDGAPVPKVIDFGIAKATAGRLTDAALTTATTQVMGTPAYMSPEQMELGRRDVDTRSDIYSLGVLLYELLTGQTPFDPQELTASGFDQMRRIIREKEPPKPSTRVGTLDLNTRDQIAQRRGTSHERLRSTLHGDIDWIVMCCLEKERNRRYETANGLVRDIERHLGNEPVTARPPTTGYILRKMLRRHRVAFAAGAGVAASLLFAVVSSAVEARRAEAAEQSAVADRARAERARDEAERHKRLAETEGIRSAEVARFLKDMLKGVGSQVARGRDTQLLRAILDESTARIDRELTGQREVYADLLETLGRTYGDIGEYFIGERLLRAALAVQKELLGDENLVVARLLHEIGRQVDLQMASYRAGKPLREAVELRERLLPPRDPDLAESRAELGRFLSRWQYDKGTKLMTEALAVQRDVLGPMNPKTATTLTYLARAAASSGRAPAQAEEWARGALEIYRQVFGPDAPETIESEYWLAYSLMRQKRYAEAEREVSAAIARCRQVQGEAHPMHANLLLLLAQILRSDRRPVEAERAVRESLALAQRHALHGPAGQILQEFNRQMKSQGRLAEAEQMTRQQIALTRPWASDVPLMLALHLAGLAELLLGQERYADAEAPAREALALREQEEADTFGFLTQSARRIVADALAGQGRLAEAEPFLLRAYEELIAIARDYSDWSSGYTQSTIVSLVRLYSKMGRGDDANAWKQRGTELADLLTTSGLPDLATRFRQNLEQAMSLPAGIDGKPRTP